MQGLGYELEKVPAKRCFSYITQDQEILKAEPRHVGYAARLKVIPRTGQEQRNISKVGIGKLAAGGRRLLLSATLKINPRNPVAYSAGHLI